MTKVLGITGGIATGKSTVVALFKKAGYPIVDGDIIAREIVAKGQPALAAIVETFGPEIVLTTGELDRKKLGQLIFANPQKRELLNETLKPFLEKKFYVKLKKLKRKPPLLLLIFLCFMKLIMRRSWIKLLWYMYQKRFKKSV